MVPLTGHEDPVLERRQRATNTLTHVLTMLITQEQKTELLNSLVTFCSEDANFLENRLCELIEEKGDQLFTEYMTKS